MNTPPADTGELSALDALKMLADETRWALLAALRLSDYQVGALVEQLHLPQSLVSYHLGLLRQSGLVQARRSEADARILYYSLNLTALERAYQQIGAGLHLPPPALAGVRYPLVVFLCTANSARSQMAEGWLRQLSHGRVPVRSAGTEPGEVHPLAVQVMAEVGVDIGYQRSKGLADLRDEQPSIAVTVCDRAREACPVEHIAAIQLHWSLPDPARSPEGAETQLQAFRAARDELHTRVAGLLALLPTLEGK
jgi:ArsR family transcriptional regulator